MSGTLKAQVIGAIGSILGDAELMGMVKKEGRKSMVRIGDLADVVNQREGGDEDYQAITAQAVGRVVREELGLEVSERRRDGYWVVVSREILQRLASQQVKEARVQSEWLRKIQADPDLAEWFNALKSEYKDNDQEGYIRRLENELWQMMAERDQLKRTMRAAVELLEGKAQ